MKTTDKAKAIRELDRKMSDNMVEFSYLLKDYDYAVLNYKSAEKEMNRIVDFIKMTILPYDMSVQFSHFNMSDARKVDLINVIRRLYENKNREPIGPYC